VAVADNPTVLNPARQRRNRDPHRADKLEMRMEIYRLRQTKLTYYTDFGVYLGSSCALLVTTLMAPTGHRGAALGCLLGGLAAWSVIEYGMHRFVLHGLEPFQSMHAEHHMHPDALICTPTLISGSLIGLLVFLPALEVSDFWDAIGLTGGVTAGYLGYSVMHHAVHFWSLKSAWFRNVRRWHARHHYLAGAGCYGVTTQIWDRLFRSRVVPAAPPVPPAR
jgi:cyclopropane-fatty-acyl-phospholipid synthase